MLSKCSLKNFVELALEWKLQMLSKEDMNQPKEKNKVEGMKKIKNDSQKIFTKVGTDSACSLFLRLMD